MKDFARTTALFWTLALALLAAGGPAAATMPAVPALATSSSAIVHADWQEPRDLPRRFRNHCSIDTFTRRSYCSDHCGFDYQFFYCSPGSFGCCRVGFGYCDWSGQLRCHP